MPSLCVCWWAVCCVVVVGLCGALDPNTESTQHAAQIVQTLATHAQQSAELVQRMFRTGFLTAQPHKQEAIKGALQSVLVTNPELSFISVVTTDMLVSLSLETETWVTTQPLAPFSPLPCNSTTTTHTTNTTWCAQVFHVDENARLQWIESSLDINPTSALPNTTSTNTKCEWTLHTSTPFSSRSPVLQCVAQLHDTQGESMGVLSVGVSFRSLSELLHQRLDTTAVESARTVLVIDVESELLVGVSQSTAAFLNPPCCASAANATTMPIYSCSNLWVKKFAHLALSDPNTSVFVESDLFALSKRVVLGPTSRTLLIVVIQQIKIVEDTLEFNSLEYITLCLFASLLILTSIGLLAWVVRFQHLHIWRVAQPPLLIVYLVGTITLGCGAITRGGTSSDAICTAREWLFVPSMTLIVSVIFAKILFAYVNFATASYMGTISRPQFITQVHLLRMIGVLMLIEFAIVGFWQAVDPKRVIWHYSTTFGEVSGSRICGSSISPPVETRAVLFFVLCFVGCILAIKTRNIAPMFAESRACLTATVHATVVATVAHIASAFTEGTQKSAMLETQGAAVWVCFTLHVALFLPRVLWQLDRGDLTTAELKQLMVQHLQKQRPSFAHNNSRVMRVLYPSPSWERSRKPRTHSSSVVNAGRDTNRVEIVI